MSNKHAGSAKAPLEQTSSATLIEEIIEKKLEDMATLLSVSGNGKSHLYEDVLDIVERGLCRIALQRTGHVKTAAAAYLGINRNTFQKKLVRLGLDGVRDGE